MKYVWSASNNAFFEKNLFDRFISAGWSLDDAIDVSDDVFNEYTKEGANKQVISSQADSLIKISRIWADFFPANTSNQPI